MVKYIVLNDGTDENENLHWISGETSTELLEELYKLFYSPELTLEENLQELQSKRFLKISDTESVDVSLLKEEDFDLTLEEVLKS